MQLPGHLWDFPPSSHGWIRACVRACVRVTRVVDMCITALMFCRENWILCWGTVNLRNVYDANDWCDSTSHKFLGAQGSRRRHGFWLRIWVLKCSPSPHVWMEEFVESIISKQTEGEASCSGYVLFTANSSFCFVFVFIFAQLVLGHSVT